jgi:hypothetical protein
MQNNHITTHIQKYEDYYWNKINNTHHTIDRDELTLLCGVNTIWLVNRLNITIVFDYNKKKWLAKHHI